MLVLHYGLLAVSRPPQEPVIQAVCVNIPADHNPFQIVSGGARTLAGACASVRSVEGDEPAEGRTGEAVHCAARVEKLAGDSSEQVDRKDGSTFLGVGGCAGNLERSELAPGSSNEAVGQAVRVYEVACNLTLQIDA